MHGACHAHGLLAQLCGPAAAIGKLGSASDPQAALATEDAACLVGAGCAVAAGSVPKAETEKHVKVQGNSDYWP